MVGVCGVLGTLGVLGVLGVLGGVTGVSGTWVGGVSSGSGGVGTLSSTGGVSSGNCKEGALEEFSVSGVEVRISSFPLHAKRVGIKDSASANAAIDFNFFIITS